MLKLLSLLLILLGFDQVLNKMRVHVQLSRVYLEWFGSLVSRGESNCLRRGGLIDLKGVRPTSNIIKAFIVLDLILKENFSLALPLCRCWSLGFALVHISFILKDRKLIRESGRLLPVSIANSLLGTPHSHRSKTTSSKLMLHLLWLICEFRVQEFAVILCLLYNSLPLLLICHHLCHNLCRHWVFTLH